MKNPEFDSWACGKTSSATRVQSFHVWTLGCECWGSVILAVPSAKNSSLLFRSATGNNKPVNTAKISCWGKAAWSLAFSLLCGSGQRWRGRSGAAWAGLAVGNSLLIPSMKCMKPGKHHQVRLQLPHG